MRLSCLILLLLSAKCFAQYPFEKNRVKKYDSIKFVKSKINDSNEMAIAHYKNYTIKLVDGTLDNGGAVELYLKNKLIKKFNGYFVNMTYITDFLYVEDIDNDGRPDFIINTYNGACGGLACSNIYTTYLMNKGKGNFRIISYEGFYNKPQKEYLFNGAYRVIGQSLATYKGHNYWLFDLYDIKNSKLINVSKQHGYPVAVPYLYNQTFKPTHKISKGQLAKLSLPQPDLFSRR
ncbi:MAG: hypothetical protein ACHQHN_15405 [Sphingobacteriales bacterium]